MGGRIDILKGVNVGTGRKFYRDKSLNSGTRSAFDLAVADMGGAKNLAAGAIIQDLSYNNYTASFSLAKTYDIARKGMAFSGVNNDGFDLSADACMKPEDKHWMLVAWLRISKAGTVSSFNNQLMHFSTVATNGYPNAMLSIVPTTDANGQPTKIEMGVRGKNYVVTNELMPLFDGNRHQFAVECEINAAGTSHTIRAYIDKVVVFSSTSSVAATVPGAPVVRRIGTSSPFPTAWTGMLHRVRVDDVGTSGLAASDILSADYALCSPRFS
nr:MAG TPA: hypothetical protein [Caudoviricetes sp.]